MVKVTVINDRRIQSFAVLDDDLVDVGSDQWRLASSVLDRMIVQDSHGLHEGFLGVLVQVRDRNPCMYAAVSAASSSRSSFE